MDNLLGAKIICMFMFLVVAGLGCLIPFLLEKYNNRYAQKNEKKVRNILAHLNCFGAGFIFSIIIFHLLPETILTVTEHKEMIIFNSKNIDMKLLYIFFFIFIGFALQLALEYVCPVDKHICCVLHESNQGQVENYENNTSSHIMQQNGDCKDLEMVRTVSNGHKQEPTIPKEDVSVNLGKQSFWHFLRVLTVQSFFLTLSLAIHSIIEGMVVGTSDRVNYVYLSSFCILAHKWIAGITVSISLKHNDLHKNVKTALLIFFIISSPLGIVIGTIAQSTGPKWTSLINAGSIGTLLLIGCEILLNEINENFTRRVRLTKWISFCSSCIFTFIIVFVTIHFSAHVH